MRGLFLASVSNHCQQCVSLRHGPHASIAGEGGMAEGNTTFPFRVQQVRPVLRHVLGFCLCVLVMISISVEWLGYQ